MDVPWGGALLFFLLCFSHSQADSTCTSSCKGAEGPFVEGNVYKYSLEGSTVTNLPGSPNDVTTLGLTATAEVFAKSKCEHVLKLSDVQVKGPDGKKYGGLSSDCAKPVKFSYNDGKLSDLCATSDDSGAALNIKRAVISLVSSIKKGGSGSESGYENDVFGICPTEFSYSKDGTKMTIHKTRNLNRCALREEFNFPFPTTPYQAVQSSYGAFETSPLLGAQLSVHQELDNGVLKSATGEEHYSYRPLLNAESAANVKVTYTLTLKGSSPGAIPANVNTPKGVYYEVPHEGDGIKNHDSINAALKKATAALDPVATKEAAREFANLVHVIEEGSKSDILQAYNEAQGNTAKNLFLDGLFYAGSAESIEAAAELLSSKKIPEESATNWYLDLNFVKHASRGSLTSLLPLLSGDKVPHQAYLGIGAVAGKFCLEHTELCHTSAEYKNLVSQLAAPLVGGCHADSHDKENQIIASLKGLRNTRYLPDEVAQKVSQCALDKKGKSRVRVAAIEAFHADAAKPQLKEAATSILNDVEEDSELRIKAYLALVESPCPKVADTVKNLVDNEPINQVGGFVVSHLRNLRASVSPEKETAKKFLGNIVVKKRYPIDQRKFSRNYEMSYSLDAVNVGAVGEFNRIFSQKSFIPRSLSLNLTTQLFGHSVNLAEIGLRAENLEWYFERYFGPKGLFKTKGEKFVDEVGEKAEEALKKAKAKVEQARPKRSISRQDADSVNDKVQLGPDYEDHHTDLDLSVKLFGSDVAWINYHPGKFDYNNLKQKLSGKLDEGLDKSRSIDINYKKGRTFLDAGVTYPTGLGFGLKVKVSGNSAVNVKVNGNLDIKSIINNPQNTHFDFQLVPSVSLELASLLSVDADVVETGVQASANLHSSTGSEITVKVLDGYGVDVKLGLPVKKQEILNVNSDVVSVVREKHHTPVQSPIKFNVKRQEHGGCFDQLNTLTGLTVCGEISVPMDGLRILSAAYGPSHATLRLEKDDESLTAYHFKAFYNNKQPDQLSLEVLLDTPNSKTNRKFYLHAQGSMKPQKKIVVSLTSPFKEATLEGLVIDTENEQAISAKLVSDGAEYSFKIGAHVSGDANRKKYEPLIEYKYPESAKSQRTWLSKKGGSKGGKQQATLGVTGAIFVEKNPGTSYRKYELKAVTLTTPRLKVTVDGTITIDTNLVATDLKASYDKDTFTLNSKVQKLDQNKYIAKIEFAPSQYPDLSGSIKWEYERAPMKIENKIVIVHGPDPKSDVSRVSITQLLKYKYESAKIFDFHTENLVTYPLLGISAKVNGGATPKSLQYDVDVTYDKNQVKSKLDAKAGTKHPTDYVIDFEAKALGNSILLSSRHDRLSNTKSKFTNSLELKPGGKYQLNALAEYKMKADDIHQELTAEITFPKDPKNIKVKYELKHNSIVNEVEFELAAGNKNIVDLEFELHKKADPSGKFKFSAPKYILSEGSFETKSGKATGAFHIDIIKTGRKIEGKGELTKTPTHVKGSGEVLWDAKKDPTKKIHLETDTEVAGKAIDSKNTIQILDYKSDLNVKGSLEGSLADGTLIGDVELVLPNGRVLEAKVNRVVHLTSDDNKIEGTWELLDYASKGASPRKLALKVAGKNINPTKLQFDGQADLTYTTPNKEDVVLHVVGKKIPQGDKWTISGQGSLSGSLVKHPLHTKLNAEVSEELLKGHLTSDKKFPPAHYDFELKAGNDVALLANGKVNQEQLNNEIEFKLPTDMAISSVKWQTSNTLNIFATEESSKKIITNNVVHWNGEKFVKLNLDLGRGNNDAHGKVTWESHKSSARTLTYKAHIDDNKEKANFDLALQWEGKTADISLNVDGTSNPIHVSIVSNVPEQGKFEIDISHKDGGETKESVLKVSGKDQKLVYSSHYSVSQTTPFVDINLEVPQGKSRFYVKIEKKDDHHALFDSKINWFANGGGNLDMNGDVNIKSLDDFFVKLFIDSPKLNLNKIEFEAANSNKVKSTSKGITFHGKSAGKEFSGNLNVVSKGVAPNVHYEGKGSLVIGETTYPLEFKITSQVEKGHHLEWNLDLTSGKYSLSSHTLMENDEAAKLYKYTSLTKYCKESACKSDEIKMSSQGKGLSEYEATSEIKSELITHMLLEHPILITSHYKRVGLQYDNKFDVTYGPEKIQYHGYVKDDSAGAELTLPKRVIAAEVVYQLLKNKQKPSYRIESNFWLDKKNNANDKTSLLLAGETNKLPDLLSSSAEARFNTPGLKELSVKSEFSINTKDRVVNAKVEADVFAKKNQKLVVEYKADAKRDKESYAAHDNLHIHSKGLNIDAQVEKNFAMSKTSFSYVVTGFYIDSNKAKREASAKFSVDSKSLVSYAKIPEGTLYSAEVTYQKGDKQFHAKKKFEVVGFKVEEELDVKGTKLKYTLVQKKDGNAQIDVDIGFTPGQIAEINTKLNKKPLVSVEVALDEAHFLKTKQNFNTDNIKELVKIYREKVVGVTREASRIFKETSAKIAHEVTAKTDDCRKALPNFKPAVQHYQKELQQFKEEITSNKNVKDLIDFLKNTFGTVFSQITAILHEISSTTDHLFSLLNEAIQKVTESVKATIPKLKESYEKASEIVIGLLDEFSKHASNVVNIILDKIKEHEKDIQEITGVFSDFLHDAGQIAAKTASELIKEVQEFVNVLWDQIQALPAYSMLKEKIQEIKDFKVPEQYWEGYHEVVQTVIQTLPTPELQQFIKYTSELLEKIVKQQPFDKSEALTQLYKELVAALQSVIAILEAHKGEEKSLIPGQVIGQLPVPTFSRFVAPPGTFRFSLLNWIRSPDLPTISEIYYTYLPKHSLLDLIPPFSASAQLLGGTEFFTFDRKHYSFKGSCSYILVKDVIDGNFTLVANMEAGKLKSIAAFDHENSVELLHDNSVLVNGQPGELPVHQGDLHMFRKFDLGTGFATTSGLMYFCTPHLRSCSFSINGYYFGKTRGLLGTYNNEPYDDNTVPEGKVTKSTSEFVNSWKANAQCPDGAVHEQPAPQAPQCNKLFSGDSSLRNCFAHENPDRYREACNKQVAEASAESKDEKACNIALSYVGYCYYVHFVKINLPDHCGKCQVGSQSAHIGETVSINVPQKEADVVFVVEQLHENEEVFKNLVTPLVSSLQNQFKEKGVTDVKFALIGYGAPDQHWPAIYTFNGKYDQFSGGNAKNIYFSKKEEVDHPKLSDKLKEIKERIDIEVGTSKAAHAFKEAFNYPFRPEALKTVVAVLSSDCKKAVLPFQAIRALVLRLNLLNSGIVVNAVTPIRDLKIEGKDDNAAANIVGFDSNLVYTQGEAKKKVLKGDEEAFKNLKYKNDVCLDLILGGNGALFSAENFINGKPEFRKNFLQVLSNKIVQGVTSEEVKKDCKCELERGMIVRTKCKVVGRKENEALVKGGVKG